MFRVQCYNGFFPCFGHAASETGLAGLPLAVLNVHPHDLHVEQMLDCTAHVVLAGRPNHLEGISIASGRLVHPFFGHQGPKDDLVRLQLQGGLGDVSGHSISSRQAAAAGHGFPAYCFVFFSRKASKAEGVINNRFGVKTFRAFSSDTGATDTLPMLRMLL